MGVDLREFIRNENAFYVMAELKRLGVLTSADAKEAMGMRRED